MQEMIMDQKIVDGHGGGRNDGAVDREIASPPFVPAETPQVHACPLPRLCGDNARP